MKPFLYIAIAFIVMILFFQNATSELENHFTVKLVDEKTNEAVAVKSIKVYPSLPLLNDEKIAGKGSHIFKMDSYTLRLIVVQSEGYKKKYALKLVKPFKKITFNMEKKEKAKEKNKKPVSSEKEEKKKVQQNEERKKLDLDLIDLN